ncbi:hypothetical protein F4861DRAFT_417670 [Xylaria intraflava]|nr:hypothetical protein F4861DRAFT_417670 [Xylaria intraflava]
MSNQITALRCEEGPMNLDPFSTQLRYRKEYRCPQCPRIFKRSENLKRHQRGHDGRKKYVCPTCAKSFARSDILSRHTTIHKPRERLEDHPHRRRACRECASIRARCSRGEPCERCTAKALCCFYPKEPQCKKTTALYIWSLAPESGDGDATGRNIEPRSSSGTLHTRSPTSSQRQSSPFGIDDSAVPYQRPSILPRSLHGAIPIPPYTTCHQGNPFASLRRREALPPREAGTYPESLSTIVGDDVESLASNTKSKENPEPHQRGFHITSDLVPSSREITLHGTGSSAESQPTDTRQPEALLRTKHRIPAAAVSHPLALNYLRKSESHEGPGQNLAFDEEAFCQPPQKSQPQSRLVDLKVYESIASAFKESQCPLPRLGATTMSSPPRTDPHDFFLTLYFKHFRRCVGDVSLGSAGPLEALYRESLFN